MELKTETRTKEYLDIPLSLEIEAKHAEIVIGKDKWEIRYRGSNPTICKNDRIVAVLLPGINGPFDAALDRIYTDLNNITDQFREILQKELRELYTPEES